MRPIFPACVFLTCVLVVTSSVSTVRAALVPLTDPTAFNTVAAAGTTIFTENLDGTTSETLISSGTSFGGITFTYSWTSGETLRINSNNSTHSGTGYLGATNGTGTPVDLIANGNTITLSPDVASSALGLFVITAAPVLGGELILTSGGVSIALQGAPLATLPDTSEVYFLGLVETNGTAIGPFTLSASLDAGFAQLPYRVDSIRFATVVPEPNSLLGCLLLAAGTTLVRRRR